MAAQPLYQAAGTVPDGSTDCLASGVWHAKQNRRSSTNACANVPPKGARPARTSDPSSPIPWREKHRRTEAGGISKREGHPPRRPPASLSWGRQHVLAAPFRLEAARRGRTGSSWSAWRAPSARANNNARGPVVRTAAALPLLVPAPASEVHVRGTPHDCVQCSAGGRAGAVARWKLTCVHSGCGVRLGIDHLRLGRVLVLH